MRPKTAISHKEVVPAPGQDNQISKPTKPPAPGMVMGKAGRGDKFNEAKQNPGPGSYMYSSSLKGGPAFSFGHEKLTGHVSDVPGPGAYMVPSKVVDLPDYAMPEKSKEFQYI